MKRKNSFIISLAALATTANITLAQDPAIRRTQTEAIREGQTTTFAANQEAQAEQAVSAVETGDAAVGKSARAVAVSRSSGGRAYSDHLMNIVSPGNANRRIVIIPKDAADTKSLAEVEDDLKVMAHILDKAVSSDDKTARAMGIAVSKWPGPAMPQNLFIEGHGALFFLNVNFPLLAPPAKDRDTNTKEKTSSEWEEARRELSNRSIPSAGGGFGRGDSDVGGGAFFTSAPAEYDANKVEDFKKELVTALKNAAHIRKLNSDETVTVIVTGPATMVDVRWRKRVSAAATGQAQVRGDLPLEEILWHEINRDISAAPAARMILRAKKADTEAFQSGKLSFEEFRKQVTVMLY